MISKKMVEALNKQINEELYSAYLYLSMSSFAADSGLRGTANWFMIQTQEELSHAMKIYNYIGSQGARPIMDAIAKPESEFDGAKALFEGSLKHEQHITQCINTLADLAREEKDHGTEIFLQWFVNEQIEEEENVRDILDSLKLAGEGHGGLYMIDKELGQRTFVPPAAEEAQ